jgi:hypothetical protein
MRTEMTAGVGFDKYWDDGGAVTPEVAAKTLLLWAQGLTIEKTGQYWAPRGPGKFFLSLNLSSKLVFRCCWALAKDSHCRFADVRHLWWWWLIDAI